MVIFFKFPKAKIASMLKNSEIETVVVSPTIVYGNDINDTLSKFVFLFKFLGIFSKNLKPVHINEVTKKLVYKKVIM